LGGDHFKEKIVTSRTMVAWNLSAFKVKDSAQRYAAQRCATRPSYFRCLLVKFK